MALPLIMGKSTPKLTLSRPRPVSVAGDNEATRGGRVSSRKMTVVKQFSSF